MSTPYARHRPRRIATIKSMSTLEKAIEIAARAHTGQLDKAGAPYILHPLRLMLAVRRTI
jgi:(p)ppGpp synthase/HD superfamily hydrolase